MTRIEKLLQARLYRDEAPSDGDPGGSGDPKPGEGDPKPGEGDPKPGEGMSDKEAELLKEVMKKKETIKQTNEALEAQKKVAEEAKKAADEAAAKLKAFEGLDPEELRKLVKEREEAENARLEEAGEFDRLKKQMAERHQAEIEALNKKLEEAGETGVKYEERIGGLQRTIQELTIGSSFDSSEYIKEELVITPSKARIIYGGHFEFDDNGSIIIAYDKPAGAASRTKLVDAEGKTLGFEAAIKELISKDPDRDRLLKAKMKPGSGSGTEEHGKPGSGNGKEPELKGTSKIAAALDKGQTSG